MRPLPLIFLGFSNAEGAFLESLKTESAALFNTFYPKEASGQLLIAREESMNTEELFLALRRYRENMVVFHFAGHAGSDLLLLEDREANASDIAQLLGAQKDTLKLVFLNGCATYKQVAQLHNIGIKAVIATSRPVDDTKARFFAEHFYAALVDGQHTLREAFTRAKQELALAYKQPSDLFRGILVQEKQPQDFEWGLYAQEDADLDWKITDPFLSRTMLRSISQDRFQELRNGPFRYLRIEDAILREPETSSDTKGFIPIHVQWNTEKTGLLEAVRSLYQSAPTHGLLVGKGGMGKTVSLVYLWESFLSLKTATPVPIYLALDEINDWNGTRKGNFLEDQLALYYQITDFKEFLYNTPTAGAPTVILLLDGIHTVHSEKLPILLEDITQWIAYPSLQIIVTAQEDLRQDSLYENWTSYFQLLELQPLSEQDIRSYLSKDVALGSELLDLLRNPMMLALYKASKTQLPEKGFIEDITQSGELLYNVELMFRQSIRENQKNNPKETAFQRFILEHLIPAIGWTMYQANVSSIHRKDHSGLNLRELLDKEIPALITEDFFDTFDPQFDRYLDERRFDLPPRQLFNQVIRDVCTEKLVLLVEENNTYYRFLHNLFRDYAAARHILNQIDLALARGVIPAILRTPLLNDTLCKMIGQIEGEHRFNPLGARIHPEWLSPQRKPNRIARMLDICRGNFREQEVGNTVRNLIQIIRLSREELVGVDLQILDLRKVELGNIRLARWDKKWRSANFFGALVSQKTLIPPHKPLEIAFTRINPDRKRVLFATKTGQIQEWEIDTQICIHILKLDTALQNIRYSADGRYILLFTATGILEWKPNLDTVPTKIPETTFDLDMTAPETIEPNPTGFKKIGQLQPVDGLYIQGCSLEHLHPDSQLDAKTQLLLRRYGAIFSTKDATHRTRFAEHYFQSAPASASDPTRSI